MKRQQEKGFILYECLISVIILSVVVTTMLQMLPNLLLTQSKLAHEQLIFNHLYQIKDELLYQQKNFPALLQFTSPIPYQINISADQVCASYTLGVSHEKTLCL